MMDLLRKFRRITYSTSYLPEIDGLRFLAIFSVVVILHISHFIDEKFFGAQLVPQGYWKDFIMHGGTGVPLFFIISGFILSMPFARWRLNGSDRIPLSYYFLRRVSRLEPPYIIALVILFIGHVWVLGNYGLNELMPHFFASLFYVHNLIYQNHSLVLPVAWSLEVEVQFYILAPVFCLLFLIRSSMARWLIQLAVIISSALYWFDTWGEVHLFVYLHYFFTGILVADLYCSKVVIIKNKKIGTIAAILAVAGYLFIPSIHYLPGFLAKILCMFILLHIVINNPIVKKTFSNQYLVIIGGMCYSIYLLHYAIVSAIGHLMIKYGIELSTGLHALVTGILMAFIVLVISSLYFLWVEKPFMRPIGLKRIRKA